MIYPKEFFKLNSDRRCEYILRKSQIDNEVNIGVVTYMDTMFKVLAFLIIYGLLCLILNPETLVMSVNLILTVVWGFIIGAVVMAVFQVYALKRWFRHLKQLKEEFFKHGRRTTITNINY